MTNRFFRLSITLFWIGLYTGCAIQSRKEQSNIRAYYAQGNLDKALSYLEKSSIKKEKKNQLLYLMEKGRILYTKKKYYQAAKVFNQANQLVDRLYTKKIREKILSAVGNDNSQTYYGSVFERSMLYYYQAQSFYKLYQVGSYEKVANVTVKKDGKSILQKKRVKVELSPSEKSKYLNRARASIVAWNSFFQSLKRSNSETIYRDDLLGKLFAANIHETIGLRDRQITLQLYKDARKLLMIQGHSYKHFDKNFKENTRELQKIIEGESKSLSSKKFQVTNYYQDMLDFLNYKILSMTWNFRRGQYRKLLKEYQPSSTVTQRLKREKKLSNISVFLEREVVVPMKAKNFEYSLNTALANIEDPTTKALVEGIGIPIITYFAMGPLGLGTVHRTGNTVIYASHNVGTTMVKHTGIEFEMPMVKELKISKPMEMLVYKLSGKSKELVKTQKMLVSSPNHDIALQAANERAAASYAKVGTRVAIKHAVAIVAAYQTYQRMKGKNGENEFFAKSIAFAQYMASSKAIAASEKADVRHWSTLPGIINLADMYLPPGEYELAVRTIPGKVSKIQQDGRSKASVETASDKIKLGNIKVNESTKKNIFSYQL